MRNIMRNIIKVIKTSFFTCFIGMIVLYFLNRLILRVYVDFSYYILLAICCFLAMTTVAMFLDRKNIFSKVTKRKVKKVKKIQKKPSRKVQRKKRKIS